jgi:hypothetical protein
MASEGSLPFSQEPVIFPASETIQYGLHRHILLINTLISSSNPFVRLVGNFVPSAFGIV